MSELQVRTSSELMENYFQADILLPQDVFVALQTDAGASLLFSIGSSGALNLVLELPGETHGWRLVDLSSRQIQLDFPKGATCRTFAAAQANAQPGSPAQIHLAMVVNDGVNDHLYISLGNSDADLSWVEKPVWTACPYNATDGGGAPIAAPSPFEIVGVLIGEATDREYVVIDVIRNPSEPVGVLARFYLDLTTPASPRWRAHDLAIDVQAAGYDSCLGRAAHAYGVDGLYTKGQIGPLAQLLYTPLYNAFDPSMPAPPSRLALPGGLVAEAIAAVRNADNSSDLYVTAAGGLYHFASTNQDDGAIGELVVKSELLTGVRKLFAYQSEGTITLWGLNANDSVFYLTCPQANIAASNAWNVPLTIITGVDAISPYIDRSYSANTFFAHRGTGLVKAVKTPSTGLWSQRPILLPPSDVKTAGTPISSYTTYVQVTDANGQAVANVPVSLCAANVTSVYINHLYYVVGPTPIEVETDALGTVTIVEQTHSLAGTRFTATVGQQQVPEINPMQNAFTRNSQYTTASSLQGAQIVNRDGSTRPLIPPGTSQEDLQRVAYSNQCLAKAYGDIASTQTASGIAIAARRPAEGVVPASLLAAGFGDSILVDLGDLFSWLESGIESAIDFIEDAAEGVWYLVATIAGKVFHGVLDCVEKIVAAITWVYNAIKVAIEDVIAFLQFLFGWQDILTTHRVLKNLFLRLAQYEIGQIESIKSDIGALFEQMIQQIDSWADLPDFDQTASSTSAANPPLAGQNSAPSNLGIHHFQGNCASSSSDLPDFGVVEDIFKDLVEMMESEEATIIAAVEEIKTQIIDQFETLSVTEIIKRFLAIVADTILKSTEKVIVVLLDLVAQLMTGMIDVLQAELDIPVLSWLYNRLTGEDLSFLDLICLIAAIPVTLIYKATAGKAPFPQGDSFTDGLIDASSLAEIQALFHVTQAGSRAAAVRDLAHEPASSLGADDDPTLDQAKLRTFGIVAGIAALVGSVALIITTNIQRAAEAAGVPIQRPKTLAAIGCVSNIAYVSPNIATLINAKTDNWYANTNNAVTAISILKGIAAIPASTANNKAVTISFAGVETLINTVWNAPVIANIVANHDAWDTTYKSLIPESIGGFTFNLGGMLELPITLVQDPEAKVAMAATQAALMLVYGVMMVVAGGIYEWAPNQHH